KREARQEARRARALEAAEREAERGDAVVPLVPALQSDLAPSADLDADALASLTAKRDAHRETDNGSPVDHADDADANHDDIADVAQAGPKAGRRSGDPPD
ncbi:MAG: hypothetical protein KF901_29770, partial [Myxococcales bacterium]|nr:hypothetical protein [Myxococcales bacterium]